MSWQPKETIPRDGTVVDLWTNERNPNFKWGGDYWWGVGHNGVVEDEDVLYWMPVPASPVK